MPAESTKLITITFNQQTVETPTTTLQYFLAEHGWQQGHFLVVINDNIITKSDYSNYQLTTGDSIDVLSPISGG